ncbi:MAG: DUF1273 family protein [Clostridia bacterium]|nr:DUF1273 family protein [Clostridia bacterium]
MIKQNTCCFTGHRPNNLPWGHNELNRNCKIFKKKLYNLVKQLISEGYIYFLTGMAEGFDLIAAETILKLKRKYKLILIAVIPCLNQTDFWNIKQQNRYKKILKKCDDKIIISPQYTKQCMFERNQFLINHSSTVISCYNGISSGTGYTIKLAKIQQLKIININPKNNIISLI